MSQPVIAGAYVGMSLLLAAVAATSSRFPPRALMLGSAGLVTLGLFVVGATETPAVWLVCLAVVALGLGAGTTGSVGLLLSGVGPDRIVTAMVVWSQIGIAGYLVGPLAGGIAVDRLGFLALGLAPAVAGGLMLLALRALR